MSNILDLVDDIVETSSDLNEQKTGGGDYAPPPAGGCYLRLVSYIEIGTHKNGSFQGKPKKDTPKAILTFELHGAKHPPVVLEDGTKIVPRIDVKLNIGQHQKSPYSQLFAIMNWEKKAKHFVQLIGQGFRGNVTHYSGKGQDGKEFTVAQLVYTDDVRTHINIFPPFVDVVDEESGESTAKDIRKNIPDMVSQPRLFMWHTTPDKHDKMWASIHIPTPEGAERSRNKYQDMIRKAVNFGGSNIEAYLSSKGILDVGDVSKPGEEGLDLGGEASTPAPVAAAGTAQDTAGLGLD